MRTIKFRGKNPRSNQWETGNLVVCENGETRIMYAYRPYATVTSTVIPETVGQFTGLNDGEGVEIYEGDILQEDYPNWKYEVFWDNTLLQFAYRKIGYEQTYALAMSPMALRHYKVIGNVHDNKDLIQETNQKS